jgi:hypothetical protein
VAWFGEAVLSGSRKDLILKRKTETTKTTNVHENQRAEAGEEFIIRVKSSIVAKHLHFVLFRAFRGFHFGM